MINKMYRHVSRPAALALLVALAAACGKDTPIDPATDNGRGTPIAIGQLRIASTADADAATPWQDGNAILVSATPAGATTRADATTPLTAVYTYTTDGSWTPKADTKPLYVEHISPDDPIIIESWGGDASSGADADIYTNQSTADRYRRNDHLQCPTAKLTARTLDGELTHRRVDFVLHIADGDYGALNALPDDAVLTLNDGNNGTNASATSQKVITAYREGKTADGTTTFRALIKLEDVPGISISGTGGSTGGSTTTPSGTVSGGRHLLGTLAYTMPASNGTRTNGAGSNGTPKTLKIYYSITSGTGADASPIAPGGNVLIEEGKRITVSATFVDLSHLDATASLGPWTEIKAGDAGTGDMNMIEKKDETTGKVFYEIYTAHGLKKFADLVNGTGNYDANSKNPAANAKLMTDIDLSIVCGATKGDWTPIGIAYNNPYSGCFDGQEHTVTGLYIATQDTENAGLFGCIGGSIDGTSIPTIRHLRVEAVKINSSANFTGVLAGRNIGGIITDCHAKGDNVSGAQYTGGLVGHNDTDGIITNCQATGNVKGTDIHTGGLVGVNEGTITECQAKGDVTGTGNTGGLVGINNATITDCYATGNVTGTGYATGGLVGTNYYDATITACYATSSVKGSENTGGLVGYNNSSTITACYATGNVTGTGDCTGGLVGLNSGTITACYATGNASGTDYATGGLVGILASGTLQHCATTQSSIYGSGDGAPPTDCQSGRTSFSEIRTIVASSAAQAAWGSSINNRVLDGPWLATPADSPTAIWQSGNGNSTDPSPGSLLLWWQ